MGSFEIIEDDKTYDPENDVWVDKSNHIFVKNQRDYYSPIFIDITGDVWTFCNLGTGYIDWSKLELPKEIEIAFKIAIKNKLKTVSYGYLNKCRLMLREFSYNLDPTIKSFEDIKMTMVNSLWQKMSPAYLSFFRELYTYFANNEICGASQVIANKIKGMKVRNEVRMLKDVLNWHPTKGALTQEEETLIKNRIQVPRIENNKIFGIRLFCWLLFSTLKRSKQICELKRKCLKIIKKDGVIEYFIQIKPIKYQTGDPNRWWPITEPLYLEMKRYSSIPSVQELQEKYDRFWVLDCPALHREGLVSAADAKSSLMRYIKTSLKLVSPRTNDYLHVTPTRIRHTGATRLAYKGVSRDIISEILEHDDPGSCQSYIDAVGYELCPSLDRADRNMGSLFAELNQVYFTGKVIDEINDQPIVIPDFSEVVPNPLFIGSCARDTCLEGSCKKHPFVGCYNGCSSFLAWREADHHKALTFAEKELERWHKASGNVVQSSTIKEYEDLRDNILAVIECIEQLKETTK